MHITNTTTMTTGKAYLSTGPSSNLTELVCKSK